jgi:putative sigma-54 modulation protein
MKTHIVGRHVEITPAIRDYAEEKVGNLDHYFAGIQHVDIVVAEDGVGRIVEMVAVLGRGARLVAKAEAGDVLAAIDQAEGRLQKQIRRFHARLKAHRDRTRIGQQGGRGAREEEATYEQVVREMLEEDEKQ